MLADEGRLTLVIAGRSLERAAAFCRTLGGAARAVPAAIDRAGIADRLDAFAPDILVDATGPFQAYGADPYPVVRACLAHGVHDLDLADGAGFVEGIALRCGGARRDPLHPVRHEQLPGPDGGGRRPSDAGHVRGPRRDRRDRALARRGRRPERHPRDRGLRRTAAPPAPRGAGHHRVRAHREPGLHDRAAGPAPAQDDALLPGGRAGPATPAPPPAVARRRLGGRRAGSRDPPPGC
ncbi:hypothetical protein [uncultured Methylobacterium sp.]|uniref:hypothetical protein n=1 Tax=uncultured Methylobacterium sp. TaxID=157278 RepID=UPI0035CA7E86